MRAPDGGPPRVLVLGLGASGLAMLAALRTVGWPVRAADARTDVAGDGPAGAALPADTVLGPLGPELLDGVDLVCTSPGVPPTTPALQAAADRGTPVWSEPELAWRLSAGRTRLVAVTGTNGKTTTTQMIAACLGAPAAGNIGVPLVTALTEGVADGDAAPAGPPPLVVAELSSFQLHHCHQLRPDVAVLLNVADDHLDWHGGMAAYRADKARIWQAQRPADTAVVLGSDAGAVATAAAHPPPGRLVTARVGDGVLDPGGLQAPGPHNAANATVAAHAAIAAGADPDHVRRTLADFRTGAHRLELVRTLDGVDWVNDSKATNPHAALAALSSYDDVIWIAGGLNKGLTFDSLAPALPGRVRHLLAIGSCGPEVAAVGRTAGVPTEEVGDLRTAVARARQLARAGTTVLLAPAAASMDQFTDYAHRGDTFRDAVQAL
jgi:UDP-N-acetylmuramoylalanine--D-glutamate ligase